MVAVEQLKSFDLERVALALREHPVLDLQLAVEDASLRLREDLDLREVDLRFADVRVWLSGQASPVKRAQRFVIVRIVARCSAGFLFGALFGFRERIGGSRGRRECFSFKSPPPFVLQLALQILSAEDARFA